MRNTTRVDEGLFREQHYLGKPAADEDRIVARRINILERYPEFFGSSLSCIEAGCGSGSTITRLAKRFQKCMGIDIFDYSAEFEKNKQRYQASNASFRLLDLETTTPEEQFDRLISFEVIEHLKSEDSLSSYFASIKDGGMAAITVPNKWWVFETHGAQLPLLPWNRVPFFSWLPRAVHERYANARIYTRQRIIHLLEKHGFIVVDSAYITAPMDVLREGWLKKALVRYVFRRDTTSIPLLATSVFVLVHKLAKHE